MSTPLSLSEAKDLIRLCETGRLYEIEAWIHTGRSLTTPKEIRKTTPLGVAISTGWIAALLRLSPAAYVLEITIRPTLPATSEDPFECLGSCGSVGQVRSRTFNGTCVLVDQRATSFFG